MWIKLLGAIAIIFCAWFLGKNLSDNLKKREESLKGFHSALKLLESEISFSHNSIDIALKNIGKSIYMYGFFEEVSKKVKEKGVRLAWREGVLQYKEKFGITDEDSKILLILSSELGVTDRENQIKNIRYVMSMLADAEIEAHEKFTTLSKLYRSISMSVGAVAVILLI